MEKNKLLEGLEEANINILIKKYTELFSIKKEHEAACEILETKVKIYLKGKKWDTYRFEDINVQIVRVEQMILDKDKLKLMLTAHQLSGVSKFRRVEKVLISTKKQREKISRFVNG